MIQALARLFLTVAGLLGGYAVTQAIDWQAELGLDPNYVIILFVILGAAIGFLLGGILGREMTAGWMHFEERIAQVSSLDLVIGTVGLMVGLTIGFLLAQPLRFLSPSWLSVLASAVTYVVTARIGVSVALMRRRDFARLFPGVQRSEPMVTEPMTLLDTSVVIDGRFPELTELGFITGDVRVPRFVLAELQTLADSADDTRRARGRRGLDLLATLPKERSVGVLEVDFPEIPAVDEKLIRVASDVGATLVTVDYNLTKVARVSGVRVLNLNEVAAALRPTFIPGDSIRLLLAKPGKEPDQGVGYLDDGTMVVVQGGRPFVGSDLLVEVTSVLQTAAGRMIFARLAHEVDGDDKDAGGRD